MADLRETLLGEEIRVVQWARRSGVLSVTSGEVTKGLFFRAGRIVFASSTLEQDKLGENLIRLGRISRREFAVAFEAARVRHRRLGETLVAAGVTTGPELGRLLAHQVQTIVLSLFTWTAGAVRFLDAEDAVPPDLALDLSTHRLLFEGARVFPDAGRLERALGGLGQRLHRVERPPFDHARVTFSPAERAVLEAAARGTTLETLLARARARDLAARAAYALVAGGLVETEPGPGAAFEEDTGTFRLALPVEPMAPTPDRRARILALYEALPRASHYEVLGVGLAAGTNEVDEAYRRLVQEEDEWRDLADDVHLASVISTLRLKRREAHRVLSDRESRVRYDDALGALRPAPPPPAPPARPEPRAGPPAPAPAPPAGETDPTKGLRREARGLLDEGRVDDAVARLLEAVDRAPRDREAHRLLALALADHPTLFRTAERHFVAALETDPRDIELRWRLAGYYKKARLGARALIQLHALLAMAPDHREARRELEAMQKG